mmetsp:Transcript_29245/g.34443  ORF Transcript_29245/g.34443 Transcript_29245/m.34443 type:complete len:1163 (+) Transcript_29245:81-3569(+)
MSTSEKHPPSFYCPISRQVMHDPVVLSDGHSYERRHIERWLTCKKTSPVTGTELPSITMFPNHSLRNSIEEYFKKIINNQRLAIQDAATINSSSNLMTNIDLQRTVDSLMQTSVLVNADMPAERALQDIVNEAKQLIGAEVGSLFLIDKEKQQLYSTINSTGGQIRIPMNAGIAGHVATTGKCIRIDDAYSDPRFNQFVDKETGFYTRNMVCCPIKTKKGNVIGVAQLINKLKGGALQGIADPSENSNGNDGKTTPRRDRSLSSEMEEDLFTANDQKFLSIFASQAACAIANNGGHFEPLVKGPIPCITVVVDEKQTQKAFMARKKKSKEKTRKIKKVICEKSDTEKAAEDINDDESGDESDDDDKPPLLFNSFRTYTTSSSGSASFKESSDSSPMNASSNTSSPMNSFSTFEMGTPLNNNQQTNQQNQQKNHQNDGLWLDHVIEVSREDSERTEKTQDDSSDNDMNSPMGNNETSKKSRGSEFPLSCKIGDLGVNHMIDEVIMNDDEAIEPTSPPPPLSPPPSATPRSTPRAKDNELCEALKKEGVNLGNNEEDDNDKELTLEEEDQLEQLLFDASSGFVTDVLALEKLTRGKPLSTLSCHFLKINHLYSKFDIDEDIFKNFIIEIEKGYDLENNPYHNKSHAASVVHLTHALLKQGRIGKLIGQFHHFRPSTQIFAKAQSELNRTSSIEEAEEIAALEAKEALELVQQAKEAFKAKAMSRYEMKAKVQLNQDIGQEPIGAPPSPSNRSRFQSRESSTSSICPDFIKDGDFELLACLIAAMVHDYEHPGVNNTFLVKSFSQRSLLYNDKHVNEQHHVAAAFSLLRKSEFNFLSHFSQEDFISFRQLIIDLVIGTDMDESNKILNNFKESVKDFKQQHNEFELQLQQELEDAFGEEQDSLQSLSHTMGTDASNSSSAYSSISNSFCSPRASFHSQSKSYKPRTKAESIIALQMVLKASDLGHLALPWDQHITWVKNLESEFFKQGDREKELGFHNISFLMDRDKPGVTQTQVGFFDFVVKPLFDALYDAFALSYPMKRMIDSNYLKWRMLDSPVFEPAEPMEAPPPTTTTTTVTGSIVNTTGSNSGSGSGDGGAMIDGGEKNDKNDHLSESSLDRRRSSGKSSKSSSSKSSKSSKSSNKSNKSNKSSSSRSSSRKVLVTPDN